MEKGIPDSCSVQIRRLRQDLRYGLKGSGHDEHGKSGPDPRKDHGCMGVENPQSVQHQIAGHLSHLKRQDHEDDIDSEKLFLSRKTEPGKGPRRRSPYEELSCRHRDHLDTGIPEHGEKSGGSDQQLFHGCKGRIGGQKRRPDPVSSHSQRRQISPVQLILWHPGSSRHKDQRQPHQKAGGQQDGSCKPVTSFHGLLPPVTFQAATGSRKTAVIITAAAVIFWMSRFKNQWANRCGIR